MSNVLVIEQWLRLDVLNSNLTNARWLSIRYHHHANYRNQMGQYNHSCRWMPCSIAYGRLVLARKSTTKNRGEKFTGS